MIGKDVSLPTFPRSETWINCFSQLKKNSINGFSCAQSYGMFVAKIVGDASGNVRFVDAVFVDILVSCLRKGAITNFCHRKISDKTD